MIYFKVVTCDLKSVGLLGATPVQYKIGEWTYPFEPLSSHPRKGGGLWAIKRRSDAFRLVKYLMEKYQKSSRVFECIIGDTLYESSYRIKTDKIMLIREII